MVSNALGQQAQDELHRNSHVADDRFAAEYVGSGGDTLEEVLFSGHWFVPGDPGFPSGGGIAGERCLIAAVSSAVLRMGCAQAATP